MTESGTVLGSIAAAQVRPCGACGELVETCRHTRTKVGARPKAVSLDPDDPHVQRLRRMMIGRS